MARVTEAEVEAIIDVDSSLDLSAFIAAANLLVTELITDSAMGDPLLKEIERWLSAHFVAIREPRAMSRKQGPVAESYSTKLGMGLKVTRYGQQAILLDTSGALELANKENRTPARIDWLGT